MPESHDPKSQHPILGVLKRGDLLWCEGRGGNVIAFHLLGDLEAMIVGRIEASPAEFIAHTGTLIDLGSSAHPEVTFHYSRAGNDCVITREFTVPLRLLILNGQKV